MKIVIAGGSGFIGRALALRFKVAGCEVVILSRSGKGPGEVQWDGKSLGPWASELEGAAAVINLSGEPAILRWTPENRKKILNSRVDSTRAIGSAIMNCKEPPKVWVNASAVGYYGDTGDRLVDESAPPGDDFLAGVCKAWEAAVDEFKTPATRKAIVRVGFPISLDGGGLQPLVKLTNLFLGGQAGSGMQYLPWVHIDDLTAIFQNCVENEKAPQIVNGVGPNPAPNKDFMKALRMALGRPWSPPAPAPAMRIVGALIGIQVDPVLASSRVVPTELIKSGFKFKHPVLEEALADLFRASEKARR